MINIFCKQQVLQALHPFISCHFLFTLSLSVLYAILESNVLINLSIRVKLKTYIAPLFFKITKNVFIL